MTRDDIIKLARDAGFYFHDAGYAPILHTTKNEYSEKCFERFAALVEDAEREACAKVCDSLVDLAEAEKAKLRIDYARMEGDEEDELRAMRHELTVSTFNAGISKCAATIRARSNK